MMDSVIFQLFFKNLNLFLNLVALYSEKKFELIDEVELKADGIQNVWICEVGSVQTHGTFDNFKETILNSSVHVLYKYDDSFIECMIDNQCLADFTTFFDCLADICSVAITTR